MNTILSLKRNWDAANIEAAERILARQELFGGPGSFPCVWARLLLARTQSSSASHPPMNAEVLAAASNAPQAQEQASASANTAEERTENA